MKIFISNHLEVLAELLKEELFQGKNHPFDKRWIVVPNERVKQELFLQWAHDPLLQVATGYKMINWCEALSRLFPHLPSQAELSLKIENALKSVENAEPLLAYLNHGGIPRKASLCDRMSTLFLHYLNQPEEKLVQWLEKTGWQQSLWRAIFGKDIPWKTPNSLEGAVYLFHPFQFSPYHLNAFKQMKATCFLFSPCAMYWGDFHTLQEQGYLLKRAQAKTRKELLQFFENEHPLLANWGRRGRQLLSFFEDEEWIDAYQEPVADSLLKTLQEEMLTLSISEKIPDSSIQIHSAPSKLREVEVVWEIIQRLPFKPSEILVLAPEMQSYAAVIELVFRQRGGPFDFAIFCLEARSKSPLMQGLEALLALPHYRFSKESVEKLLFCPPFLKKFDFTIDDARLLLKWISEVHIRYDLKGDHPGSWEEGLKRLVKALVTTVRDNRLTIDFSEADVLSRWITVIQLFQEIAAEEQSLKEWAKTLKSLVDQFFSPDPDDDLMRELDKLQQMDIEGKFPFSSIEPILKNIFQQKSGTVQGSHLQAVRFASLEKGALIPAKVVILMGMEEGSFPRQDSPSSLQQLPVSSCIEEDKYLFLEAFCSAREMFIITYLRIHPEDGKSQKPCPMVEELSQYCSHLPIVDHPFSPFDPAYFQEGGFRSFSKSHFDALQKDTIPEPKIFTLPPAALSILDIRMLRGLARHPLQFFFEERLGIDFEWREHNTEFVLSPLDMVRLRKASLKKPLEALLHEMEKEGRLPVGSFSKAAVQKIRNEIEAYHEMLEKLHVRPEEIYAIELKSSCKQPTQIDAYTWIYPALHINNIVIQGRIDEMSPQGLLFHGEDTLADQLKAWPLFLIVNRLGLSPHLLFTKKGKISELKSSQDSLEKYIRYAEKALIMPSPLYPKWARTLFKEGKIPVAEEDEIIAWAQKRNLLPPIDLWLKAWSPYLQEVVDELL
jgi:exodeoxyribonuclease V gamma subunit